jgi:hypothetical protein
MTSYHLAQLNIAKMKYPAEAPEMAEFMNNLDRINELAEQSPGFIWRLQTEEGDATGIDFYGPDILVNMSIWQDSKSLHDYVYRTSHAQIMSRRKEWFERFEDSYTVLWWVPEGSIPTLEEANKKLELLRAEGPTAEAFSFKQGFPAPQ